MSLLEEVRMLEAYERIIEKEKEQSCPEGQQWCPIQKKCVEPGQMKGALGPGRAGGRMAEEEEQEQGCPEGQKWDSIQEKCVEPGKELKLAVEALAIRKGASVETIANFLMKEFNIDKKKAMKQAKEYYSKAQSGVGFHESLDEAQMKKSYGGRNLKYRLHFGMDVNELINLVRHITFEEIIRPKNMGPSDPTNQTQYNKVWNGVMNEIQAQFKSREEVALKEIKKILPEIITDSLTVPKIK